MSYPFRHFQARQPVAPPRLDLANPICRGLVLAVVPIGGLLVPVKPNLLAGGGEVFADTASPPTVTRAPGLGKKFNGTTQISKLLAAPVPFNAAASTLKECSILTIAIPNTPATATLIIAGLFNSASVNPSLDLRQGASANTVQFNVRDTSATTQVLSSGTTGRWAQDVAATLVGTRSEANNFHRIYIGGELLATTTASAIGSVSFDRVSFGARATTTDGLFWPGSVHLTCFWNRALTPQEVASLSANPWQVFAKSQRRLWSSAPSGGVTSGTGSSTGAATAAATGAAISAQIAAASGAGSASATGAATSAQVAASAGVGTAAATGASTSAQVGSAAGVGAATGVSAVPSAVASASGAATVQGVGASTSSQVASSSGSASAGAAAAAVIAGTGAAIGAAAAGAIGASISAQVGSSAGVAVAQARAPSDKTAGVRHEFANAVRRFEFLNAPRRREFTLVRPSV
jgi:hypothetical protein